jgi:hypothetical protein
MGKRNAYKILVGKPEEKRSLGRPRRRSEDNIKMDVRKIGLEVVVCIHKAQDKGRWRDLGNTVKILRVS